MDPISIALGVVSALIKSGAAGSMLSGIGSLIFGSKGADVADKVINSATKVFGTTDPRSIELAIQQDKSKAERFITEVTAETERYRIEVEDRMNARARDIALRSLPKDSQGSNTRANVMIVGAFFYVIAATTFIFFNIKDLSSVGSVAVLTFLTTTMGNVTGMLQQAFGFEFGSSRGSADKANTIATITETLTNTTPGGTKK